MKFNNWKTKDERPRWIFLRLLGLIYLIAFVSLWSQVNGLIGSNGILPASNFLNAAHAQIGTKCYWLFPTLCWFNSSDTFLNCLCGGGALLSLLLIIGICPVLVLFFLWVFYLSLTTIGQDFLSFQWDILLLETGFLAIFLAPLTIVSKFSCETPPSQIIIWLFRWLLFRLMFFSGLVKILSRDPTWGDFTALSYHYETQPLPHFISYCMHQLPVWFQKFSVGFMFVIELLVPFLIFGPRQFRFIASIVLVIFQLLIIFTGNYCFFNLLTIALCILLLDDLILHKKTSTDNKLLSISWPKWIINLIAVVIILLSSVQMSSLLGMNDKFFSPILKLYRALAPFHFVNGYGLFAVMTTSRPEIIVEGSNDGKTWLEYEFKFKPGDLKTPPEFVAPHQPRLDWQMWFAALGDYQNNQWFINFCRCLLQGSKDVLKLLEKNPFPNGPPTYIRALIYDYHFTDLKTKEMNSNWWRRELKGLYCPVLSLRRS